MGPGNRAGGEEGEALSDLCRKAKHWHDAFFSLFFLPP